MQPKNPAHSPDPAKAAKIFDMPELLGKVAWEGDLSEMREDNPRRPQAEPHNSESK
jgi:hypothetical protein